MMETKGLKMFKDVKTQWISLLYPLSKYTPLLAKRFMDNSSNQTTKVPCCPPFSTIIDLYVVAIFLNWNLIAFVSKFNFNLRSFLEVNIILLKL
jgi:hypothetical protein